MRQVIDGIGETVKTEYHRIKASDLGKIFNHFKAKLGIKAPPLLELVQTRGSFKIE